MASRATAAAAEVANVDIKVRHLKAYRHSPSSQNSCSLTQLKHARRTCCVRRKILAHVLKLTTPADFDEGQGHQGRDGGRPFQQRRRFDPPGTRLRKKLLSLLDSSFSTPQQEIGDIASIVVQHSHDDFVRDTFVDLVVSLALEQPAKVVFAAAVVRSVNASKPDLALELLGKLGESVNREIRRGRWREVKLGLRLLACVQDVVEGDGVLTVLDELFQRVIDLQSNNPEEVSTRDLALGRSES